MNVYTINATTTLVTMECGVPGCGIPFAIPEWLETKARNDHGVWWYCPNGHHIHYTGKTAAEVERARVAELERQLASRSEDVSAARMATEAERRSKAAVQGHLTRARNRADKGVCQHCHRHFPDVAAHVASKHPDAAAHVASKHPDAAAVTL